MDLVASGRVCGVKFPDFHFTTGRLFKPDNVFEQNAFARATWPHDAEDFPGFYLKIDVAQDGGSAEILVQFTNGHPKRLPNKGGGGVRSGGSSGAHNGQRRILVTK